MLPESVELTVTRLDPFEKDLPGALIHYIKLRTICVIPDERIGVNVRMVVDMRARVWSDNSKVFVATEPVAGRTRDDRQYQSS